MSFWPLFSAPEPKAEVHYCDHTLSVVRPSLIYFHIFDFSSETAEQNSTKLDRKQDLNVLYQVCVFRADLKNKMAALSSDLAETLLTSFQEPLKGIRRNLAGSKISICFTKFVFFGPIGKPRWPPQPLIGWDIFDFSSEIAELNWKTLDRKQDLKVLYQVCVFRADQKNKMAALASDLLKHFWLLLWNCWKEFYETWQEARLPRPLPSLCFFRLIGKHTCEPVASKNLEKFSGELAKKLENFLGLGYIKNVGVTK